jgi:hypothetical protein
MITAISSAYDEMQAWSTRRAAAMDSFTTRNAALAATLSGSTVDAFGAMMNAGSSTSPSTFVSNEVLGPALFGAASNIAAEETLMANIVYTRMMKEKAAKQEAQLAQLDELQARLGSFDSTV